MIKEKNLLEEQFGFFKYYDFQERNGWLLNYNIVTNTDTSLETTLYFIDDKNENFAVSIPFFPSFIIECENINNVEEYLKRKFEGKIEEIKILQKTDASVFNHLNKLPKEYLKIYFKDEGSFLKSTKDIKQIVRENKIKFKEESIYSDFSLTQKDKRLEESGELITAIHEFDIPYELSVCIELNIRCGLWYTVSYSGENYSIKNSDKVISPDLKINAFDIETTKQPLKFPNADFDEIMMISILTEKGGELIVNRDIVTEDIESFEFSPKDDIKGDFSISNEQNEEALIIRFIEIIQNHRPHIITTYNGGFFDFPFLEKRALKYNLVLSDLIGIIKSGEDYTSSFIVHLDSYKWVKRDSYLPMGSQGLKNVARAKLGYFPDELDPELMVECAKNNPQKLASYSVSDAVATFFLYTKYVHPFIFSLCTLIPLSPFSVLSKGSGTLCESLLIAEAENYKILIPQRKIEDLLLQYKGHIAENLTYVGGHVECLKSGIFRTDFNYEFYLDLERIEKLKTELPEVLKEFDQETNYDEIKKKIEDELDELVNYKTSNGSKDEGTKRIKQNTMIKINSKPYIYHLDVGAMYPNIILTNRLQPISVINNQVCVRCDYNTEKNMCKRKMEWELRAEFYPPTKEEVNMIKNQLSGEYFELSKDGIVETKRSVLYKYLPEKQQAQILKDRINKYSKKIYKKIHETEIEKMESIVCQREISFYVETVRKFRDQRYYYKKLFGKAKSEYESEDCPEKKLILKRKLIIYESLQVAHKCVLNSFYGYVMRRGARWHSMEMAAIVCNTGGKIIREAKKLMDDIGITLELDTDGIWCLIPQKFPNNYTFSSGKRLSFVCKILNHLISVKFNNPQYQEKDMVSGEYKIQNMNSIAFEIDGPYKAMIIPSSKEENKNIKKRYVIINNKNQISELKGFECKRRGEMKLIKKFQEDLFQCFTMGTTLEECYEALANTSNYWIEIIDSKGKYLPEEEIFNLLSESKNMSKELEEYKGRKTNGTCTAKRLGELLGTEILREKGLKCEYVISAFPEKEPVANRAIPVDIFRADDAVRSRLLQIWLKKTPPSDIREILDWKYYFERLETVVQKIIVIPAYFQGIKNPFHNISLPKWAKAPVQLANLKQFNFTVKDKNDIEDLLIENNTIPFNKEPPKREYTEQIKKISLFNDDYAGYIQSKKKEWFSGLSKPSIKEIERETLKIEKTDSFKLRIYFKHDKEIKIEETAQERIIYIQSTHENFHENEFFKFENMNMYLSNSDELVPVTVIRILEEDFILKNRKFDLFVNHLSIKNLWEEQNDMIYQGQNEFLDLEYLIISSFSFQKKVYFVFLSKMNRCVVSEEGIFSNQIDNIDFINGSAESFVKKRYKRVDVVVYNTEDQNKKQVYKILKRIKNDLKIETEIKSPIFLDNFKTTLKNGLKCAEQMEEFYFKQRNMCKYTKIPLLNLNQNVLDMLFIKELKTKNVVLVKDPGYPYVALKEEYFTPGYYKNICIEIECVGSLILGILEYKSVLENDSKFSVFDSMEFITLKYLISRLMYDSVKNKEKYNSPMSLLNEVVMWIKQKSKLISKNLKNNLKLLQQKYVIHFTKKLKELGCEIVSVNKEIIIINTNKNDNEGYDLFVSYLTESLSKAEGFEMLKFRVLKKFMKLVYLNPWTYYFLNENKEVLSVSRPIPLKFLEDYFHEKEISNDVFYSLIVKNKIKNAIVIKDMLDIYSLKKDVSTLKISCYKMLGLNEFHEDNVEYFMIDISCRSCLTENILRIGPQVDNKCIKCYRNYEIEDLEASCMKYIYELVKLIILDEKFCEKCKNIKECRINDFCRCGGLFKSKSYKKEFESIYNFIGTKKMQDYLNNFKEYFY